MPRSVTIASLPAAFEMMKGMRVEDPEWSADYRSAAGQALREILQDQDQTLVNELTVEVVLGLIDDERRIAFR